MKNSLVVYMTLFLSVPSHAVINKLAKVTPLENTPLPEEREKPRLSAKQIQENLQKSKVEDLSKNKTWQNVKATTQKMLGDHPDDATLDRFIQQEVAFANTIFPAKISENVIALKATAGHKTIINNFKVLTPLDSDIESEATKKAFIQEKRLCDGIGFVLQYDITVIYHYHTPNNHTYTMKILPADCGF